MPSSLGEMKRRSGRESGLAEEFAFFGQNFGRFFEALAAIGPLAEFGIDRFGIAPVAPGRAAKIGFTDGIADAGVHGTSLNFRSE